MTKLLEQLFAAKHRIDPAAVHALQRDDIAAIRAMVQGREKTPHRIRALDIFATLHPADMLDVLNEVLRNPQEDPAVRAVAAAHAARFGGPDAEQMLLRSLAAATDSTLRTHIAAELARVGTQQSTETLRRLLQDPEASVRRQATFALTVIAHRTGLGGFEVPAPPPSELLAPTRSMVPFTVQQTTANDLRAAVDAIAGDTYGVRVVPTVGFSMKCGPNLFVLFLDSEHLRGGLARLVARRPLILGLLAARSPAHHSYFVTRLILAGPRGDGRVYVSMHATDGTLTQYGTGRAEGDTAEFSLRSTWIRGNVALELSARVHGSEVTFSDARTALSVVDRAAPAKFTPPTA